MENNLIQGLGKIAGIAGISLGIFFFLFRDILRRIKVPGLTPEHWYRVILVFMVLVWLIAIVGMGVWFQGSRAV